MPDIRVLPQGVADKIAAGEVAERPAAVVKELLENSIDAGADSITVEIKNGGVKYIRIEDNGKGIKADELETAFLRHATSKLRDIEDLFEINTMGFRGEALASICAVSDVEVLTKTKEADEGCYMSLQHGAVVKKESIACNSGTVMIVENLFANVPARMKFLKKDSTEAGYVADTVGRIALSRPDISFRYISDGNEIFSTSGDGQLKNAVLNIYGIEFAKALYEVDHIEHGVKVTGVVGKAELARGNRTRQTLFVNGRYIKNHVVSKVIEEAYRNILMTGRFPFFVLNVSLSPQLVDVNVHPAKTEIKFANEKEVYDIVFHAVKNALYRVQTPKQENDKEAAAVNAETDTGKMPLDTGGHKADKKEGLSPEVRNADRLSGNQPLDIKNVDLSRPATKEFLKFLESMPPSEDDELIFRNKSRERDLRAFSEMTEKTAEAAEMPSCPENRNELPFPEVYGSDDEKPSEAKCDAPKVNNPEIAEVDLFGERVSSEENARVKVIGQVFDTYVIAQKGDKMFLLDQHAVHERKRFEKLRRDYKERGISGQALLESVVLSLDAAEMQTVRDNIKTFSDFGFLIEEFGSGAVIIRETPVLADSEEIKNLVLEILSAVSEQRPMALLSFEERALDMIACKYAIKANKNLSTLEMEALIKDLEELEAAGITSCPHGRPLRVEFSKREIEKLFKRIV